MRRCFILRSLICLADTGRKSLELALAHALSFATCSFAEFHKFFYPIYILQCHLGCDRIAFNKLALDQFAYAFRYIFSLSSHFGFNAHSAPPGFPIDSTQFHASHIIFFLRTKFLVHRRFYGIHFPVRRERSIPR